jgi:hypothetical protein
LGFFVSGTETAAGTPACGPEHKLPKFGPPSCGSDPPWVTYNLVAYDSKLMFSVATDAQEGDAHLSHVIYLTEQLLKGKIKGSR